MQSVLPDALEQYLADLTGTDTGLLAEVEAFTLATFGGGAHILSGRYQGRLLALLSQLVQPQQVLEVGTFTGYSALCLAEGLAPGGQLHTLDRDARLAEPVRGFFDRSAWAGRLHLHIGPALQSLEALPGPFELVFIDADKRTYGAYLEAILPKCRPGTLLLIDNVLWKGRLYTPQPPDTTDAIADYLASFNQQLAQDARLEAVMLPVRDGLWAARVR